MMGVDARMLVRTTTEATEEDVLSWAIDLYEAFGDKVVLPMHPDDSWDGKGRHCLEIVDEYYQDGPSVCPGDGETLIRVSLYGRYYGPGYERGNAPALIAVARWLDETIPESEVWYGGDSSGVEAKPFGEAEREELWNHFVDAGHRPYYHSFDVDLGQHVDEPICELCKIPMIRNGWWRDGQRAAFYCEGCGHAVETQDGGETFEVRQQ